MSSSDEPLGWTTFAPRPAVADGDLISPAAEVAAVLQRYRIDVDAARAATDDARRLGLKALAEQAVLAVQIEGALATYETKLNDASLGKVHQHLRILKDRMLEAAQASGLEVVRLAGKRWDEVAAVVEVDGWLHRAELDIEMVVEELEPVVLSGSELIRGGRVVMGAPLQAAPASEEVVGLDPEPSEREEAACRESS